MNIKKRSSKRAARLFLLISTVFMVIIILSVRDNALGSITPADEPLSSGTDTAMTEVPEQKPVPTVPAPTEAPTQPSASVMEAIVEMTDENGNTYTLATQPPTTTTTTAPTEPESPPQNDGYRAYLTFDDGPSNNTMKILDILDRYNIKATFFVIYHKGFEAQYKAIVDRGHTLALHSYTHNYSQIYSSDEAFYDDLDRLADYLENVTGVRPEIMRFPGGSSNAVSAKYNKGIMTRLTASVGEHGYRYFDWNVDSGDANGNNIAKDKLVGKVRSDLGHQHDAVVLMHDTDAKATTVDALPEIISIFTDKGYELLPLTNESPECHHRTIHN